MPWAKGSGITLIDCSNTSRTRQNQIGVAKSNSPSHLSSFVMSPSVAPLSACVLPRYLLFARTFTLQILNVCFELVEVLSLLLQLLFQLSQTRRNQSQLQSDRIDLEEDSDDLFNCRHKNYLSISLSRMNLVSLACSRLVHASLKDPVSAIIS